MRLGVELSKGYRAGGIVQEGNIQFHKAQFNKAYTEGDKADEGDRNNNSNSNRGNTISAKTIVK